MTTLGYRKTVGGPPVQVFSNAEYGHIIPTQNNHHQSGVYHNQFNLSEYDIAFIQQQIINTLAPEFGVRVMIEPGRIRGIAMNLSRQMTLSKQLLSQKVVDYICKDFRIEQTRTRKLVEYERNFKFSQMNNPRYHTLQYDESTVKNNINTTPNGRNHRGTIKGGNRFFSLK